MAIGASPDGLVNNPISDPPDGLVEFKNTHTSKNMTLDEAVNKVRSFCLCYSNTQKLQLKDICGYYYQMQCAMYCTNHKWCDFVAMTETIHIERINSIKNFGTLYFQN